MAADPRDLSLEEKLLRDTYQRLQKNSALQGALAEYARLCDKIGQEKVNPAMYNAGFYKAGKALLDGGFDFSSIEPPVSATLPSPIAATGTDIPLEERLSGAPIPQGALGFLDATKNWDYGQLIKDLRNSFGYKRNLLQKYFPERFGPDGKENLSTFRPAQIGYIFKQVYDFYSEKAKKR